MKTVLPMQRLVLLVVLTWGLYFFYWFYVTWKHYRDFSKSAAYPAWHTLALMVPVYGFFRVHAHVRTFKELAANKGIATTLSPGWVVIGVAVSNVITIGTSFSSLWGESLQGFIVLFTLDALAVTILVLSLLHVQININRLWLGIAGAQAQQVRYGPWDVVLGVVGLLYWLSLLLMLGTHVM